MGKAYGGVAYGRARGYKLKPFTRRKPYRPARTMVKAPNRMGARVRTGKRAYVAVRRRKQKMHQRSYKTGDNSSISATYLRSRFGKIPRAIYTKMLGVQTRVESSSGTTSSTTGRQAVWNFINLTRPTLEALKEEVLGVSENEAKFVIQRARHRLHIKNQSNNAGKLLLYDIEVIRMPPSSSFDTLTECWVKGLVDMGDTTSTQTIVGQTPFTSPEFRQYFRIKKVTHVPLEPGQQHEHCVTNYINRVVSSTTWANHTGVLSIPGLTTCVMAVWHGSLGHESATPSTVTYLPMKLDFAVTQEVKFGYVVQSAPKLVVTSTHPTTLVDPDFMGENQDADVNDIAA